MDMTIKDQLRMARGQTRSNRKLTVTPLRCRDRRLVHRPFGAHSLGGKKQMMRSLIVAMAGLLLAAQSRPPAAPARQPFTVVESTIREMQTAMAEGRVTAREIVRQYLTRIATYEDKLNAVIVVNPHALEEAEALDRERAQGKLHGPLHGRPIRLKDNIHTTDMPTTGGALAFDGLVPPYEAT